MKLRYHFACGVVCLVALTLTTGCLGGFGPPMAGETRTFDGIEFQWCPPGTFTMGSPESETDHDDDEAQHVVTLSKGFWLSKYETTQTQWVTIMGSSPSHFDDPGNENNPVEQVTWEGAQDFIAALNASAGAGTYRLPTESEWEYAYRAGTAERFYWGDDAGETDIGNYAWYQPNSGDTTHPVGEKMPNAWGLYDMGGNVNEWCQDFYGDYPAGPVTDPQGAAASEFRVIRGGGYDAGTAGCRAASRGMFNPISSYDAIGVRLLRTQN